jgi:hypothetical protein
MNELMLEAVALGDPRVQELITGVRLKAATAEAGAHA